VVAVTLDGHCDFLGIKPAPIVVPRWSFTRMANVFLQGTRLLMPKNTLSIYGLMIPLHKTKRIKVTPKNQGLRLIKNEKSSSVIERRTIISR